MSNVLINDGRAIVSIVSRKQYAEYKKGAKKQDEILNTTLSASNPIDKSSIDSIGTSREQALANLKNKKEERLFSFKEISEIEKKYIELSKAKAIEKAKAQGKKPGRFKDSQRDGETFDMTEAIVAAGYGDKLKEMQGESVAEEASTEAKITYKPTFGRLTGSMPTSAPKVDVEVSDIKIPDTDSIPFNVDLALDTDIKFDEDVETVSSSNIFEAPTLCEAKDAFAQESADATETAFDKPLTASVVTADAGKEECIAAEDGGSIIREYANYGTENGGGITSEAKYSADGAFVGKTYFDGNNNVTYIETPKYDKKGQIVSVDKTDAAGNLISTEKFSYDRAGRKKKSVVVGADKKQISSTDWAYDSSGNIKQETFKDAQVSRTKTFKYNKAGQMVQEDTVEKTAKRGKLISKSSFSYERDDFGKITLKTNNLTKVQTFYAYDDKGSLVEAKNVDKSGKELGKTTYRADGYDVATNKSDGTTLVEHFDTNNKFLSDAIYNDKEQPLQEHFYEGRDNLVYTKDYQYSNGVKTSVQTTYEAEDAEPKIVYEQYTQSGDLATKTLYSQYDGNGYRKEVVEDKAGNVIAKREGSVSTTNKYNDKNELVESKVIADYYDPTSDFTVTKYNAGVPVMSTIYDHEERQKKNISYDEAGKITGSVAFTYDGDAVAAETIKDAKGRPVEQKNFKDGSLQSRVLTDYDEDSKLSESKYDNLGRLASVAYYRKDNQDVPAKVVNNTYYGDNSLVSSQEIVLENGQRKVFKFDRAKGTIAEYENDRIVAVSNNENTNKDFYTYNDDNSYDITTKNAQGKSLAVAHMSPEGKQTAKETYKYSQETGEVIERQNFDAEDKLVSTSQYVWDNNVHTMDIVKTADGETYNLYLTQEGKPDRKVFTDYKGAECTEFYDGSDSPKRMQEVENGRITQEIVYGKNDETYDQYLYQYEDTGNIKGFFVQSFEDGEFKKYSYLDADKNLLGYDMVDSSEYEEDFSEISYSQYNARGEKIGEYIETNNEAMGLTSKTTKDAEGQKIRFEEKGEDGKLVYTEDYKDGELFASTLFEYTNGQTTAKVYDAKERLVALSVKGEENNALQLNTQFVYDGDNSMPSERIVVDESGTKRVTKYAPADNPQDLKIISEEEYSGNALVHSFDNGEDKYYANGKTLLVCKPQENGGPIVQTFKDARGRDYLAVVNHPSGQPAAVTEFEDDYNKKVTMFDENGNLTQVSKYHCGHEYTNTSYDKNGKVVYRNNVEFDKNEFNRYSSRLAQGRGMRPSSNNGDIYNNAGMILNALEKNASPAIIAASLIYSCGSYKFSIDQMNNILKASGINSSNPVAHIINTELTPAYRAQVLEVLGKLDGSFKQMYDQVQGGADVAQQTAERTVASLYSAYQKGNSGKAEFKVALNNMKNIQEFNDANALCKQKYGKSIYYLTHDLFSSWFSNDELDAANGQILAIRNIQAPVYAQEPQQDSISAHKTSVVAKLDEARSRVLAAMPIGIDTEFLAQLTLRK